MADKPEDAVLESKKPEDEGSLASIVENLPKATFSGHPAMHEAEEEEVTPGTGAPDDPPAPAGEDGKPPEKADPPEPPKPKHATWEETEKARLEAEKRMTVATTETATERKAREVAEAENVDLKRQLAEKETAAAKAPEEKPAEAPKPVTKVERKARVAKALSTIRGLDRNDPDYEDHLAEAWTEAGIGGTDVPFPSKEEITKEVAAQVKADLKAERDAERATEAAEAKKTAAERAWGKAVELGAKAGLELEDQESADYILFERMEDKIPKELEGKPLPEIVDWMVKEVRTRTGKVALTQAEREAAARRHQESNLPLGAGGRRPPAQKPKQEESYTLGGIIESQRRTAAAKS